MVVMPMVVVAISRTAVLTVLLVLGVLLLVVIVSVVLVMAVEVPVIVVPIAAIVAVVAVVAVFARFGLGVRDFLGDEVALEGGFGHLQIGLGFALDAFEGVFDVF
jgi:hypothetical protein